MICAPLLLLAMLADDQPAPVHRSEMQFATPYHQAFNVVPSPDGKIDGQPVSSLARFLADKEQPQQRARAMMAIARWEPNAGEHVAAYIEALHDADENIRGIAAQSLGYLGARVPETVPNLLPHLAAALGDPQDNVRAQAAYALRTIGPRARSTLPALRRRYESDKSATTRQTALWALVDVSRGSDEHADILRTAITQAEFPVNSEWLTEARTTNKPSKEMAEATHEALRNSLKQNDFSRIYALQDAAAALATMGPLAKAAAPDLLDLLRKPLVYSKSFGRPGDPTQDTPVKEPADLHLRLVAAWAIIKVDPDSAPQLAALLKQQLSDESPDVRLSATIITGRLAYVPVIKQLAPELRKLEADQDLAVAALAHLAALRCADVAWAEQDESKRTWASLPQDGSLPDIAVRRTRLQTKVAEMIKLCEAGDMQALSSRGMLPTNVERGLLQGGYRSQIARGGKRELEQFEVLLQGIDPQDVPVNDRVMPLKGMPKDEGLRLVWFDGDWWFGKVDR